MSNDWKGKLYEFAARRWWTPVRGRVRGASIFAARQRVRGMGFRHVELWPAGQPPRVREEGAHYAAGLRIVSREAGRVVCRRRTSVAVFGGLVLIAFGAGLATLAFMEGSTILISTGIGLFFGLLGVAGLAAQPCVVADGVRRRAILDLRIWFLHWHRELDASEAAAIVLDRKDFASSDYGSLQYVISIAGINGEQWPIDSSSNHAAQLELAAAFAECLAIPLRDYGDEPSPVMVSSPNEA